MSRVKLLVASATLLATAGAGFVGGSVYTERRVAIDVERQVETADTSGQNGATGYSYINPLLECGNFLPASTWSHVQLRSELEEYIADAADAGTAHHVSVYFRELNDGHWVGIGESEQYAPASLLKVPVMTAILQEAERRPEFLSQIVPYVARIDTLETPVIRDRQIILGTSYSVNELLTRMIRYSDNEAQHLLVRLVGPAKVIQILGDMGIAAPNSNFGGDYLTVRQYASIFRLLYNATYLSRAMSEGALELLSTTTFGNGIRAPLPSGTVTATKFGERGWEGTAERQLHDCGIIYAPGTPYLLCVMTKGTNFDALTSVIADVSFIVHHIVSEQRP